MMSVDEDLKNDLRNSVEGTVVLKRFKKHDRLKMSVTSHSIKTGEPMRLKLDYKFRRHFFEFDDKELIHLILEKTSFFDGYSPRELDQIRNDNTRAEAQRLLSILEGE